MKTDDVIDILNHYLSLHKESEEIVKRAHAKHGTIRKDIERIGEYEEYSHLESAKCNTLTAIGLKSYWGLYGDDETARVIEHVVLPLLKRMKYV